MLVSLEGSSKKSSRPNILPKPQAQVPGHKPTRCTDFRRSLGLFSLGLPFKKSQLFSQTTAPQDLRVLNLAGW